MSELGDELITAARVRIGQPFRHHYKPDVCQSGRITTDTCMENGMDNRGYDCSGLVIASICDVLGVEATTWSRDFRHVRQLDLGQCEGICRPGNILLYFGEEFSRAHVSIATLGGRAIHASGKTKNIKETDGVIGGKEYFNRTYAMTPEKFVHMFYG